MARLAAHPGLKVNQQLGYCLDWLSHLPHFVLLPIPTPPLILVLAFLIHEVHNRTMALLQTQSTTASGSVELVVQPLKFPPRFLCVLMLLIGGLLSGCTPGAQRQHEIFSKILRGWESNSRIDQRHLNMIEARREELEIDVERAAYPEKQLLQAALYGQSKLFGILLKRVSDRNTLKEALSIAAAGAPFAIPKLNAAVVADPDIPYVEIVRMLLEKRTNIQTEEFGNSPLEIAASHGATAVVQLLLDKGARANDIHGGSALLVAACMCSCACPRDTTSTVLLLLQKGANIEARNMEGHTSLMSAAVWGRNWIVKILLDKGARIEARDNQGNTPLLLAAFLGALPGSDAIEILLERGANIEARNNAGDTALLHVARSERVGTGPFEGAKVAKMLLDHGANVRATDKMGKTPVELALATGNPELISLFTEASAKRNKTSEPN